MKSKFLALIGVVLILSMMLGACASAAPGTEMPATAAPATEAPATVAPASAAPVELVYWAMWNETEKQAEVLKAAIAEFEANHANVTVKVNWAGRDIKTLLGAALDGGQVIDIFDYDQGWLIANVGKYLTPLDDYVTQPAYDEEGTSVLDSLLPAVVTFSRDADGKLMNLPYQPYAVAFFYNKDIFDQAGITETPVTWDDFIADGELVKAAGYDFVTVDQDAYADLYLGYAADRLKSCDFLMQTLQDETGEMWNDPAWVQMAQDFGELAAKGLWSPQASANASPAGQAEVATGTAAVYLNGTWFPTEVASTTGPDFNWGQFAFPALTADKNNYGDIEAGSQALAINVN